MTLNGLEQSNSTNQLLIYLEAIWTIFKGVLFSPMVTAKLYTQVPIQMLLE